jgi:hypothetical protein
LPCLAIAAAILLTLGSFPAVQGIKLQQLSLLVGALLAGSVACLASGLFFCGGVLLALATIKPQLAWLLTAWLLVWAVSDWKNRRRFVFGFGLSIAILLGGAEAVLPGWWRMFAEALRQYHRYTQNQSVIEVTLTQILRSSSRFVAHVVAEVLAIAAGSICIRILWRLRRESAESSGFAGAAACVLALTILVIPMDAPYNQVLLFPAILVLLQNRKKFVAQSRLRRATYLLGGLIVGWQWAASIALTTIYLALSHQRALDGWTWPFFATFVVPVWAFGAVFLYLRDESPGAAPDSEVVES